MRNGQARGADVQTGLRLGPTLALVLATGLAGTASANALNVYGGVQAGKGWQDVLAAPGAAEYYDDGLVGVSFSHDWRSAEPGWSLGFEAQANLHVGRQDYWEFNLPIVLRYAPPWSIPLRSFAYGLGPSLATSVPQIEIDKGGDSQTVLFYWFMEAEIGPQGGDVSGFVRLHHRSNGFGTFDKPGSSNAVVVGLRKRF